MTGEALLAGLGRRTRELRTERHLTLRELGERSGLSTRFLVQVESGEGNISVKNLSLLAGALGDIIRHGQRLPLRGLRERRPSRRAPPPRPPHRPPS